MTAPELYEIVREWPREAWPKSINLACFSVYPSADGEVFVTLHDRPAYDGKEPLRDLEDAVLLFEASGMRWLEARFGPVTSGSVPGIACVVCGDPNTSAPFTAPSRIEAIGFAIESSK